MVDGMMIVTVACEMYLVMYSTVVTALAYDAPW